MTVSASPEITVVRGTVIKYTDWVSRPDDRIPVIMEIKVDEVFKGKNVPAKIRVHGDRGADCRPYLNQFPPNTQWIFALNEMPSGEYTISVCGEFWLKIKKNEIKGQIIYDQKHPPKTISLSTFREMMSNI